MTALNLVDILARNHEQFYMLVDRKDGSVFKVVHLENNRFEGTQVRVWLFHDDGSLWNTSSLPAPKGELDLLAEYGEDAEMYNDEDGIPVYRCVWCD